MSNQKDLIMIKPGLVALVIMAVAMSNLAADPPDDREAAARQGAAQAGFNARVQKLVTQFIEIEQIARLPEKQREAQIAKLYGELAPAFASPLVEGIISSFPADLFQRGGFRAPGNDSMAAYAQQLDIAAASMSPQEMADAIREAHGGIILKLAAKVRCVQALERHRTLVVKLIDQDLGSDDAAALRRACATIHTLGLKDFNERLLKMYLADGKFAAEARSAITWLNDADMAEALIADIAKDPAALRRHHGLLNGMLWGHEADPRLVKLLDSPEADHRYWAALAIQDCTDAALAPNVKTLLGDKDARVKKSAAHMAGRLPKPAFKTVRAELLKLLADDDVELRVEAARAFAEHKDAAAGPTLLDLWQQPISEDMKVHTMQAVAKLADSTFGYNLHEWARPTAQNLKAIEQFERWIAEHPPEARP